MPVTTRPATPSDIPALDKLYADYDVVEFGQSEMTPAVLESIVLLEGSESVVAEDAGIVGFANLAASGELETVVDPSYAEARTLQGDLLAWAVQRAAERDIARLEHWTGTKPGSAGPVLADAGFRHARILWRMRRDLVGDLPEPVWPAGVRLRPFELERDGREVWQVVMTSFAGNHGSHQRPYDAWVQLALGGGWDVLCAVEDDVIIGVATTGPRADEGHVGQLGVLPDHRGRGIALALLAECFRRDAAAGHAATSLNVDGENANAQRLYAKAGMQVTNEYHRWEREVRSNAGEP